MIMWDLWYLFPIGMLIAVLAMSSGISGSNFWIPVFTIWMNMEPQISFWLSLLTVVFGFGSGVYKNFKIKTINWFLVGQYLKVCIPGVCHNYVNVHTSTIVVVIDRLDTQLHNHRSVYKA